MVVTEKAVKCFYQKRENWLAGKFLVGIQLVWYNEINTFIQNIIHLYIYTEINTWQM